MVNPADHFDAEMIDIMAIQLNLSRGATEPNTDVTQVIKFTYLLVMLFCMSFAMRSHRELAEVSSIMTYQ